MQSNDCRNQWFKRRTVVAIDKTLTQQPVASRFSLGVFSPQCERPRKWVENVVEFEMVLSDGHRRTADVSRLVTPVNPGAERCWSTGGLTPTAEASSALMPFKPWPRVGWVADAITRNTAWGLSRMVDRCW